MWKEWKTRKWIRRQFIWHSFWTGAYDDKMTVSKVCDSIWAESNEKRQEHIGSDRVLWIKMYSFTQKYTTTTRKKVENFSFFLFNQKHSWVSKF